MWMTRYESWNIFAVRVMTDVTKNIDMKIQRVTKKDVIHSLEKHARPQKTIIECSTVKLVR